MHKVLSDLDGERAASRSELQSNGFESHTPRLTPSSNVCIFFIKETRVPDSNVISACGLPFLKVLM